MEDFGNIIYVIIGIGWFLWNAYRKAQQGKDGQSQPTAPQNQRRGKPAESAEESEPFKSLEDMILEQFGEKKEPEPVIAQPVSHKNQDKFLQTDLTHAHLSDDYKMSETEMQSHRVERQVRKTNVEENEEESLIDKLLPEGFNLRQAVVVNAILDRPYK